MKQIRNLKPLARAVGVITAVIIVVSGVTFAGLQSQQSKLSGNTIQTATANLQISTDGANYANSQVGFAFSNLIPGGPAMPTNGYKLFLKNAGGAALALKLAVSSIPSNSGNVDLSKVHVILVATDGSGASQSFTLADLIQAIGTGGEVLKTPDSLAAGQTEAYSLQVSMDADAVTGPTALINNVDFSFSGVATS